MPRFCVVPERGGRNVAEMKLAEHISGDLEALLGLGRIVASHYTLTRFTPESRM